MELECKCLAPYPKAGRHDITRIDKGVVPPELLLNLPGMEGEEKLFDRSPWGRMTEKEFTGLAESLKKGWKGPVTVFVEKNGQAVIIEGNHRLRAAAFANIKALVEIRYFGNSQEMGLIL